MATPNKPIKTTDIGKTVNIATLPGLALSDYGKSNAIKSGHFPWESFNWAAQ